MSRVYALDEVQKRKLKYVYGHSGIDTRYSVLPDYSLAAGEWEFFPPSENLEDDYHQVTQVRKFLKSDTPVTIGFGCTNIK